MTKIIFSTKNSKLKFKNVLIFIIVLSSIWGLSEVVLNEWMRSARLPFRAGILAGIGMLTMGILIRVTKRSYTLLVIPILVVLLKQMAVPILGVSVLCKANSCIAVGLQAFALAGVVGITWRKLNNGLMALMATGAGSGLLSAALFYFVGLRVAPCPHLLSLNHPGGFATFILTEGFAWAAFSAALFPLGYWLGEKVSNPISNFANRRPGYYYAAVAGFVISSWLAIAVTVAAVG